jgi:hypothetical protein
MREKISPSRQFPVVRRTLQASVVDHGMTLMSKRSGYLADTDNLTLFDSDVFDIFDVNVRSKQGDQE